MATRRFKSNVDSAIIVEEVGAANNSHVVEVTVDLANLVNDAGTTRPIKKAEVLAALDKVRNHILKGNWSPA